MFLLVTATFYCTLYVLYPRSGSEQLGIVPEYNNWYDSLAGTLTIGFVGEPLSLNLAAVDLDGLSDWQGIDLSAFLVFYISFVLVAQIVLCVTADPPASAPKLYHSYALTRKSAVAACALRAASTSS